MEVQHVLKNKRAIRKYLPEKLKESEILQIVNAGRRAQSAKNSQPWNFIVIQDQESLEKLSTYGSFAAHISGAAAVVAIITPPPEQRFSIMFDAGQAAAYMQLSAFDIGIGSCLTTIYQPEDARALLGFPAELEIRIVISFGYPLEPDTMTRKPKKSGRISIAENVHWEHWD